MMTNQAKKFILLLFVFSLGFFSGSFLQKQFGDLKEAQEIEKTSKIDLSLFWEALDKLEKKFINKDKIDYQKLLYGAISGMISALGDPYTTFLDPQETKMFLEDVSGEFEGVGMEVGIRDGLPTVIAPLEGTPAFKAGLKPGDKILAIDQVPTNNMSLEEVVKRIRGPKGTRVTLTILREGWSVPKDFQIRRDRIKIPALRFEMKEGDIAYVKIYNFSSLLDYEFRKLALKLYQQKVDKIILDLRNNPGGYFRVAVNLAGWFIDRGKLIAIERFGDGRENLYKSPGPARLKYTKVVVLINQGSASASEILAGALRYYTKAKLVGERSFGKGSVQEMIRLKDGSALKVTIAHWLTPDGTLIEGKGLKPDVEVKNLEDSQEDLQLKKAIEILNSSS